MLLMIYISQVSKMMIGHFLKGIFLRIIEWARLKTSPIWAFIFEKCSKKAQIGWKLLDLKSQPCAQLFTQFHVIYLNTLSKISMKNLFLFELHPISSTFFQERLEKCLKMGGTI